MAEALNPYSGRPRPDRLDHLLELAAVRCDRYALQHKRNGAERVASEIRELAQKLRLGVPPHELIESMPQWERVIRSGGGPLYSSSADGYAKNLVLEIRFLVNDFVSRMRSSAELNRRLLKLLKLFVNFELNGGLAPQPTGSRHRSSVEPKNVSLPASLVPMMEEAMKVLYIPVIDVQRLELFVKAADSALEYIRIDLTDEEELAKLEEELVNFEADSLVLTLTNAYQEDDTELQLFSENNSAGGEFVFSDSAKDSKVIDA